MILRFNEKATGIYIMQVKKKEDREDWQSLVAARMTLYACITMDVLR